MSVSGSKTGDLADIPQTLQPIQVLSVSAIFLDSIFGENGFQLFQPHVEFLFREAGLAVCKEAESIGIVFLGEHPSLFCQLVEYFLGVCEERGGRGSGRSTGREGGRGGGWVKREVSGERMAHSSIHTCTP